MSAVSLGKFSMSKIHSTTERERGAPHQSALAPWIDQTVGIFPTPADCETCGPFMNQIATLPLLSCQRMSLVPSPLKSPVSTIVQAVDIFPTPTDWVTCAPFINQIATLPLVSCQRISVLPSPLKSPVPTIPKVVVAEPR